MACLKADMYYHGLDSLLCVAPWVSFPKGPYLLRLGMTDQTLQKRRLIYQTVQMHRLI